MINKEKRLISWRRYEVKRKQKRKEAREERERNKHF
jgi:hypothetical protein